MNLIGDRFGRLVALRQDHVRRLPGGSLKPYWLCRCDCGTETIVRQQALRLGATRSCGCLRRENGTITHGMRGHPLYWTWRRIRDERCALWADFARFVADIGERPEGDVMLRRLKPGAFGPENFRWAKRNEKK